MASCEGRRGLGIAPAIAGHLPGGRGAMHQDVTVLAGRGTAQAARQIAGRQQHGLPAAAPAAPGDDAGRCYGMTGWRGAPSKMLVEGCAAQPQPRPAPPAACAAVLLQRYAALPRHAFAAAAARPAFSALRLAAWPQRDAALHAFAAACINVVRSPAQPSPLAACIAVSNLTALRAAAKERPLRRGSREPQTPVWLTRLSTGCWRACWAACKSPATA
jgi:hypothetical protein